ncbi:CPBP family intramembrane metalloprotease domain-containing protein [Siphonobacter sp. BAB-5385]|uniref:CPBP family intramembrane glutamic endopeptidase n=1 Tax=Siphonobacter sp. BAB-5385 TaxID=1864822 RepID=UPI000B9DF18B|nr:type II CAAX endopeptidase family protein [Siphonobacter sp. BAB-5385]OZI05982.1 CPBP family intramembrane metalloprotease domain-containing protein [Siphonobacter sp. BAB-5385]
MIETPDLPTRRFSPFASLLILFGLMVVLGSIAQIAIVYPLVKFLTGADFAAGAADFIAHPQDYPHSWLATMLMQAITSVFSFILTAYLFWYLTEKRNIVFVEKGSTDPLIWAMIVVLVIGYIPLNSLIFEWNQLLPLPQWMVDSEKQLETLTKFLTQFPSFGHFMLGLLVIGLIPALGEELLFRATLQRLFERWWGSPHVAVWLSAAIFSAYHVQFMGFFPRMILGALFGYLYVWTRNLWVPIFAHFVNNGFVVVMIYLRHRQITELDVESNEAMPLPYALVSAALTIGVLRLIYQRSQGAIPQS